LYLFIAGIGAMRAPQIFHSEGLESMTNATEAEAKRLDAPFRRLICLGCGFSYDEALGLPEHGLAPGTRWDDVPSDWVCPDCGTPKDQFEMIVIGYAPDGALLAAVA
jgi:rubredoxin